MRLLLDAGFAVGEVMPLIVALENLVLGSALDLTAPDTMWELTDTTPTPRLAEALAAAGEGRAASSTGLVERDRVSGTRPRTSAGST